MVVGFVPRKHAAWFIDVFMLVRTTRADEANRVSQKQNQNPLGAEPALRRLDVGFVGLRLPAQIVEVNLHAGRRQQAHPGAHQTQHIPLQQYPNYLPLGRRRGSRPQQEEIA
jgi:hypothetical protein